MQVNGYIHTIYICVLVCTGGNWDLTLIPCVLPNWVFILLVWVLLSHCHVFLWQWIMLLVPLLYGTVLLCCDSQFVFCHLDCITLVLLFSNDAILSGTEVKKSLILLFAMSAVFSITKPPTAENTIWFLFTLVHACPLYMNDHLMHIFDLFLYTEIISETIHHTFNSKLPLALGRWL